MESPIKTKAIKEYLGGNFKVVSSNGHVTNLAKSGEYRLGVDLKTFEAHYKIDPKKADVVKDLKTLAKKSPKVVLATDPDREGEAIAFHLQRILKLDKKGVRVTFNEITREAVLNAFQLEGNIDQDLVNAQETRRILDRMIGFRLSRLLREKIRSRSAGRVQSVCLKLIVNLEQKRIQFKQTEYWTMEGTYQRLKFGLYRYGGTVPILDNHTNVTDIARQLTLPFMVTAVKTTTRHEQPFLPYRTASLMQDAANLLGFSTAVTAITAQQLYEGIKLDTETKGLISYPRTDATRLSSAFIKQATTFIEQHHGSKYVGTYRPTKQRKNVQNAHEAIRVTDVNLTPQRVKQALTPQQLKLYRLIYNRSLGTLMAPAEFCAQQITLKSGAAEFRGNHRSLTFDGFIKYQNSKVKYDRTPLNFTTGQTFRPDTLEGLQHFSKPPARFTEGSIVKKLEELGIGRPSTYGHMIRILKVRGYIKVQNRSLIPLELGVLVNEFLQKLFPDIINENYTSQVEAELDEIAGGKLSRYDTLNHFWTVFEPQVENALETVKPLPVQKANLTCPDCGGDLVYRYGRYDKFIGCGQFPKCRYVKVKELGSCPDCATGKLTLKTAKRGREFVGCTNLQVH